MTALAEERCRDLVWKLCSRLGWEVRPAPAMRYVLFNRDGKWITFGQSMSDVAASLCGPCTWIGDQDTMPACLRGCSSPEELALKVEVAL